MTITRQEVFHNFIKQAEGQANVTEKIIDEVNPLLDSICKHFDIHLKFYSTSYNGRKIVSYRQYKQEEYTEMIVALFHSNRLDSFMDELQNYIVPKYLLNIKNIPDYHF